MLCGILAICLAVPPLLAGPNDGGTIVVHDPAFEFTNNIGDYCGLGVAPSACPSIDTRLDQSWSTEFGVVWKVYAAFPDGSAPRLKAMTFGINYNPLDVVVFAWGPCIGDQNEGAIEIQGPGWPHPDTGTALVFQHVQTAQLVECYWFGGYNYYNHPSLFRLRDHPDPVLGGKFADDSIPSLLDPIAGYGSMGFDMDGAPACPGAPPRGACCVDEACTITIESDCGGDWQGPGTFCEPNPCLPPPPTGACCVAQICLILSEVDCGLHGGRWLGEGVPCEPENPCLEPNPVETTTWGRIKSSYH
jgi:hypothetical protein